KLRAKVDEAINWLIDKIKAGVKWLIGLVKAGVAAIVEWWKIKIPLDKKHTLKFLGTEESARLIVNEDPKPVKVYTQPFLTIKGTEDQIKRAHDLDDKISATQIKILAAKDKKDEAAVDSLTNSLKADLDALSVILQELMVKGAEEGSEQRPVEIDYPKRRASA